MKIQDSIPGGCVPTACQPYVFRWPLDISSGVQRGVGYVRGLGIPGVGGVGYIQGLGYSCAVGYVQGGMLCEGDSCGMSRRGYPLPCDLSHDAYDVTYLRPGPMLTDRRL